MSQNAKTEPEKKTPQQVAWDWIVSNGYDKPGSTFRASELLAVAGVFFPATASRSEFMTLDLREMSIADYARNKLHDKGLHLHKRGKHYAVPLYSEMSEVLLGYQRAAQNKLRRAKRIIKNMPACVSAPNRTELNLHLLSSQRHQVK